MGRDCFAIELELEAEEEEEGGGGLQVGSHLEVVGQSRNWNRRSRSEACPRTQMQTLQIHLLLVRLLGLVLD